MAKAAYIGIDNVARKMKKFYLGVPTFVPVALPVGYTQIEYIESTGNQAINTGITPDLNTRVTMSFAMKTAPNKNVAIFAAVGQFSLRWTGSVFRHVTGSNTQDFSNNIGAVGRHHADKKGVTCTVDSETKTANVSSINITTPIYFCAINNNGLTAFSSVMIYGAQIYQNEMLVRDFIPCKNASGVAGLMDVVNNVFYTSEGTGQFIAGSDTPQSLARAITKAYIGVNGVAQLFYEANSFILPAYTGQYVISGDKTKGSIQLLTSGTLTLHPATYDIFCVGGGASGGYPSWRNLGSKYYGGGGGGYTFTQLKRQVNVARNCAVVIGSGGIVPASSGDDARTAGGNTSITIAGSIYEASGGTAESEEVILKTMVMGTHGGSGGGAGAASMNGSGYDGGSDGSDGKADRYGDVHGGTGQGSTTRAFEESNNTLYAVGGGGGGSGGAGAGGEGGGGRGGSDGTANTGGGGGGANGGSTAGDGGSGIVVVRWGY